MAVNIESTTDSKEAVTAAIGGLAQKESKEETKSAPVKAKSDDKDESKEASETSETLSEFAEDEESGETKDETDADEESKDEDEQKSKPKNGFKKRIDKLNKRLSEKDQRIAYLEGQVATKPTQQAADAPKKAPAQEAKPKADNFDTHEEFIEALADWRIEQKEKEREQKQREIQVKSEVEKRQLSFQSKIVEFQKEHDDFDEALESVDDVPFSIGLKEAILESDIGPAIMYELAKNRSEYERISKLGPIAAAKEVGKIEARLSKDSDSAPEKEAKKQTKAPPPLKTIGSGKSASGKKSLYDESLSQKEWEKLRQESLAHKG